MSRSRRDKSQRRPLGNASVLSALGRRFRPVSVDLTPDPSEPELTTGRLIRILLQVSYAVAFAHERGVVHRDLKPDNVILGDYGEVRLMDWGIAKVLGPVAEEVEAAEGLAEAPRPVEVAEDRPATVAGAFAGTPCYASPEQARGETELDGRSDVYSLGVMLYQLLTGRLPVEGKSLLALLDATGEGRIRPLAPRGAISRRMAAVVHKALALAREERYGSVKAFIADLEALLENRPVAALPEGVLTRLGNVYTGRSLRFARLRTVDLDMMCGSTTADERPRDLP